MICISRGRWKFYETCRGVFFGGKMTGYGNIMRRVREKAPLVHCITNYVTANDCANLLLAAGASPIMSDSPDEAADVVSLCKALVINTGTLSGERLKAMLIAGKRANELDIPIVLDPVGAGSSEFRTSAVRKLLDEVRFSVIRANYSELLAISGEARPRRGVDADSGALPERAAGESVKAFSRKYGAAVLATGKTDIVSDGKFVSRVRGGSEIMKKVTGAGCMLSALTGAFAAVLRGTREGAIFAALCASGQMKSMAAAAERKMREGDGNCAFRGYLIDEAYALSQKECRVGRKERL